MDSVLSANFTSESGSAWPSMIPREPRDSNNDLLARIDSVIHDLDLYKRLLQCRGTDAQRMLDTFQTLLDKPGLSAQFRRSLIVAAQRLSEKAGLYPTCYELKNVIRDNQYPEAAGGFADIFKGKFEGQDVSLKAIRIYRNTEIEHFLKQVSKEAILWSQLSHPNILPLYGLYRLGAQICLVSPWLDFGSVRQYLRSDSRASRLRLVFDVANGLSYLHSNGVVHGDLKGPNILVDSTGRARLTDFGLSSVSDPEILAWTSHSSAASKGGTARYQAPELFNVDDDIVVRNSRASDIYAWSLVCFEIFTGTLPFANLRNDSAITFHVMSGGRPPCPSSSSPVWHVWGLTESIWSLMQDSWKQVPDDRPPIEQIMARLNLELIIDKPFEGSSHFLSPAQFRRRAGSLDVMTITDLDGILRRAPPLPSSAPSVRRTSPSLLSGVSQALRDGITISDTVKDGLTYKDAFDGREAINRLMYIINATDRTLALIVGRALGAQNFFHDVTYDHGLLDSPSEVYQFRTKLPSPFVSGEFGNSKDGGLNLNELPSPAGAQSSTEEKGDAFPLVPTRPREGSIGPDDIPLPSGVFTLLTDCYSPTCSRDRVCYSIACPRRLEERSRLMKLQWGLSTQNSREEYFVASDTLEPGTLWIHSVPQEIVNSVSDTEKRRQEAINEIIYTEREFVRDMEYLRDTWIGRLADSDIIPANRKVDFIAQVFWGLHHLIEVNTHLRDMLNERQYSFAVVECIGDILLDAVQYFGLFVEYGRCQLYAKYMLEKERNDNPAFAHFIDTTEQLPESRKLELNAYLMKPTSRLARYPLMFEAVLKHTPDDSLDRRKLSEVIIIVRELLRKANTVSAEVENQIQLTLLDRQLVFRSGEQGNLCLDKEGRQIIERETFTANNRDGDIHVYLFDHAILFTRPINQQLQSYRTPIPLEFLRIAVPEAAQAERPKGRKRGQHWIEFTHIGRKYYKLVLWATPIIHQKWMRLIANQQTVLRGRSLVFHTHDVGLNEGSSSGPPKINCAAAFSDRRKMVCGTDDGVYLFNRDKCPWELVKVLALSNVVQVDLFEDYQLLIVLSDHVVTSVPLDALDPQDPLAGLKRARRISSDASLFKAGPCSNRDLLCVVQPNPQKKTSILKLFEPINFKGSLARGSRFRGLLRVNGPLKLLSEFQSQAETTSVYFLDKKMCIASSKGFEVVNIEDLDIQAILHPSNRGLNFVREKKGLRPITIFPVQNEFLLCYDEFAFYVDATGRRSRRYFLVRWEGIPTGFVLHEPFVLAIEPLFVEVRHMETGILVQVIQGTNMRLLYADTPSSVTPVIPYSPTNPHMHQYLPTDPPRIMRNEILIVSDDRVLTLSPTATSSK